MQCILINSFIYTSNRSIKKPLLKKKRLQKKNQKEKKYNDTFFLKNKKNFSFLAGQGREGKNIQKEYISLKKYLNMKGRLQAAVGGRQSQKKKKIISKAKKSQMCTALSIRNLGYKNR